LTPAALKQAALEKIGKAGAGVPAPADDVAICTSKYAGLHAALLKKSLVTWTITEDIPSHVQEAMTAILAYAIASDFGISEPRYTRLRLEGSVGDVQPSLAERQLRDALGIRYVSHPVAVEYL
jgi:hypothetical protein